MKKSYLAIITVMISLLAVSAEAANSCAHVFRTTLQEVSNVFEERTYAVHITKFLPANGLIKAISKDRGRFAATVHFSLGEPVVDHPWGKWDAKPYAIVMPVKALRDQILNLYPQDTFVLGDVLLPKEAVVFIPEGESVPSDIQNRVIRYKSEDGVKSAITKFLKEIDSIEFNTESWMKHPKLGSVDIMEGKRLQRIFRNLFQDKPYLTRVAHEATPWGIIDNLVINALSNWVNNLAPYKFADSDIQMTIYQLHDSIYGISEMVSKMNLPSHARKSWTENLKELKSYLTLLEAEKYLRTQGTSMLALDPVVSKDQVSEILSRRYDRKKILAYVESIKGQLPALAEKKHSRKPDDFHRYLHYMPMKHFVKRLAEEFQSAGQETQSRVRAVIALRAVDQLVAGRITALEALSYFKNNTGDLTKYDMMGSRMGLLNLVYEVNNTDRFPIILNKQVLLFFRDAEVHRFLEEREAFQYFSEQKKIDYRKTLDAAAAE